ncbi:NAD(P)-dependent oxidoreductase [Nocardia sp. NBC_00403]|uniref:NAD(P)-dependent oxidoreductase n=1 Tax=Nocardia sp. NBC_00403 TaxID=2975990 RepID=UPI002E1D0EBE
MTSIAVVGANGRTGRIVVEQALACGHRVTAIVRRPGSFSPAPGLREVIADPTIPGSLHGLLVGHDAVISTLGAADRAPTIVYSASTAEIIAAMPPGGRLLVVSSAGLDVPADAGPASRVLAAALHRIMCHTYTDMARMEQFLTESALRWTAVRPTRLTDKPGATIPRVSLGATSKVGPQISRADLAAYLLDAVDDPHTHHVAVSVSSGRVLRNATAVCRSASR